MVLTFNYDTLLERAVNASMLVTGGASGNLHGFEETTLYSPHRQRRSHSPWVTVRRLTMLSHFKF